MLAMLRPILKRVCASFLAFGTVLCLFLSPTYVLCMFCRKINCIALAYCVIVIAIRLAHTKPLLPTSTSFELEVGKKWCINAKYTSDNYYEHPIIR